MFPEKSICLLTSEERWSVNTWLRDCFQMLGIAWRRRAGICDTVGLLRSKYEGGGKSREKREEMLNVPFWEELYRWFGKVYQPYQVALMIKNPPAKAGDIKDLSSIPGLKIPLEKGVATHCSILAWKIPWTEKPGHKESDRTEAT